jgi:hypothetical protein
MRRGSLLPIDYGKIKLEKEEIYKLIVSLIELFLNINIFLYTTHQYRDTTLGRSFRMFLNGLNFKLINKFCGYSTPFGLNTGGAHEYHGLILGIYDGSVSE